MKILKNNLTKLIKIIKEKMTKERIESIINFVMQITVFYYLLLNTFNFIKLITLNTFMDNWLFVLYLILNTILGCLFFYYKNNKNMFIIFILSLLIYY